MVKPICIKIIFDYKSKIVQHRAKSRRKHVFPNIIELTIYTVYIYIHMYLVNTFENIYC
uniref:Uncharacterized protein n=1 Tax=Anguilla anguilla TaxID=7936 RepID=A0A0E9SZ04_ANGAN